MRTARGWFLVVLAAAALTALLRFAVWHGEPAAPPAWPAIWQPRRIVGVVRARGQPVPGAAVDAYEERGRARTVRAGADGRFEFYWRQRFSDTLFLRGRDPDGRFAPTVARAERARETVIELAERVTGRGRVVDTRGEPVAGARVLVAQADGLECRSAVSAEDGSFSFEGLPEGRPLDVLVSAAGLLPYVERRFAGGDEMTVRAFPGEPLRVRVRDPYGAAIEEAEISLDVPRALRPLPPPASDASGRLVRVEAPDFLPVRAEVAPHRPTEVVLWPARTVVLRVRDSVRKRGVAGLALEVNIEPERGNWRVGIVGGALRAYPLVRGEAGGEYSVRLPRCALRLGLSAPGYADAEATLDADAATETVWMRPLPRQLGGTLDLFAEGAPDGFPLVVADASGRWHRLLRLSAGRAEIEVPPGRLMQIASPGAWHGVWLPKLDLEAPKRGERRKMALHLLPALRLRIEAKPPVAGIAALTDETYRNLKLPQRVELVEGKAMLWVRPMRDVLVDVEPRGNYFPVSFELSIEREETAWPVHLRPSAGVRYRLRDRGGNPIPFALARLWEPALGGHIELRRDPKLEFSVPTGQVSFLGLRGGDAAVEFSAHGFRTRVFSILRLEEGRIVEGGEIVLEPTGRYSGVVRDYRGQPVAGVWMKVLAPRIRRLEMPGGGERDLYELSGRDSGDAASDEQGRFQVPDATPRAPLIGCYPTARPDLAPTALPVGSELRLTGRAHVELEVPGRASVRGVYQLLDDQSALLVAVDPPMGLRPLPIELPAGEVRLFVRLSNRKWAAADLELERGEKRRLSLRWQDPVR